MPESLDNSLGHNIGQLFSPLLIVYFGLRTEYGILIWGITIDE